MATSPTIPTSFVPRQAVPTNRRRFSGGTGILLIISLIVLGLSVVAAGGVFGYEYYLKSVKAEKSAELAKAEASISEDTVEEFVRLRDRFSSAEILLNNHISYSQFFDTLEGLTLQTVRFSSFNSGVGEDRTVKVEMGGVARNFNALAAQSAAFAGEKRIKRAIFSGIALNPNNTISFKLSAEIDPRLITMEVGSAPVEIESTVETPAATVSTSTPVAPTVPVTPAAKPATTTTP